MKLNRNIFLYSQRALTVWLCFIVVCVRSALCTYRARVRAQLKKKKVEKKGCVYCI